MHSSNHQPSLLLRTRRHFFHDCGVGVGKIALASLLAGSLSADEPSPAGDSASPFAVRTPHFAARAKRVIFLFMAGAPSQLETFDNKPKLADLEGKPIPPSVIAGQRYAFIQPDAAVLGPRFKFSRHGQCGAVASSPPPQAARTIERMTSSPKRADQLLCFI